MTSSGTFGLKSIWKMLDECAPGYTAKKGQHNWRVMYQRKTYWNLPLGKHGKRDNAEIQTGHLRQLIDQLELNLDCVKKHFRQLQIKTKPP